MPDRLDTSVSCFVVRIWGGKKEHFQLLIEWKVNLDGLKYLGQQVVWKHFFLNSFLQETKYLDEFIYRMLRKEMSVFEDCILKFDYRYC